MSNKKETILYINNEYCLTLEQLKGYFTEPLNPDSSLYNELLTLQSDGLLAKWLGESSDEEELRLARELEALPSGMTDSPLISELKRIFTGSQEGVAKPDPTKSLELTAIKCVVDGKEIPFSKKDQHIYQGNIILEKIGATKVSFEISFRVLAKVNEKYVVKLESPDGTELTVATLSPYDHKMGSKVMNWVKDINVPQQGCVFHLTIDSMKWADVLLNVSVGKLTFKVDEVGFDMIFVEGGTFMMGATDEQRHDANSEERPAHLVKLSDYYIGQTPVTQKLWQAVMDTNKKPSHFGTTIKVKDALERPVEMVNWDDCQIFINKLNKSLKNQLNGLEFHLPTEAQWEFAARGGNKRGHGHFKYAGSNKVYDVAYCNCSETKPVRHKAPNELGIYDMSGNVMEWCHDWWKGYDSSDEQTDPMGPASGSCRIVRGGAWNNNATECRVSYRQHFIPTTKRHFLGLRLALWHVPSHKSIE